MNYFNQISQELKSVADSRNAKILAGYFKTGKGEYGHGDVFLGIKVPIQRVIAKKYKDADLVSISKLLKSKIHEHRLTALMILADQFEKAKTDALKKKIVTFYLKHITCVNNWDLVDSSAQFILGEWLYDKDRSILYKLARSKNLWERRISIIATFAFIYKGEHKETFKIAEMLLKDEHDLIHKASGWMLREVGKRARERELLKFLDKHYKVMPRTMLRYAIERLSEPKRRHYLSK